MESKKRCGEHIKRIYLDTCVWCRPFDEASNPRILEESNAFSEILRKVDAGELEIIGSSVLLAEINMITPKLKEETVLSLVKRVVSSFATVKNNTERLASEIINECSLDAMDALHIAIAIENKAELFIITDDIILNKNKCISEYMITVKNPCEVLHV